MITQEILRMERVMCRSFVARVAGVMGLRRSIRSRTLVRAFIRSYYEFTLLRIGQLIYWDCVDIQMIREAKHFIYIGLCPFLSVLGVVFTSRFAENQFFISNPGEGGPAIKNRIAEALVERILRAAAEGAKFRVCICTP